MATKTDMQTQTADLALLLRQTLSISSQAIGRGERGYAVSDARGNLRSPRLPAAKMACWLEGAIVGAINRKLADIEKANGENGAALKKAGRGIARIERTLRRAK